MRIDQQGDAAFRQRADFRDRERQVVGRKSHGLGVEIAAREDSSGVSKHEGVVGDGVGFGLQHFADVPQDVQAGPHDLRLATDRVRILDPVAIFVRGPDLAALHEIAQHCCNGDLAAVPAHALDAPVERRVAALYRVRRHRPCEQRRGQDILGTEYACQRQGRRHLRAIKQRKPLFGRQPNGFDASLAKRDCGRNELAVHTHLADTDQGARHVSERCEIARCTDRSFGRNAGVDLVIDQGAQRFDELEPHPRKPLRQRNDLHQHDQSHDVVIEIDADTHRVRPHEFFLQQRQLVVADSN